MQIEVAIGCMRILANLGKGGYLDSVGVSRGDFERLISDHPWLGAERNRMTNVLMSMINGSIDAMGLPRFQLPAEYLAAGVAVFVHPINCMSACVCISSAPDAEKLGRKSENGNVSKAGHVYPDQIFALVVQLFANEARTSARMLFEKQTGLALDKVKKEPVSK